jgi:inosose dehydratase
MTVIPSQRIGYTVLTWPLTPAGAKDAFAGIADAGYRAAETFGFLIDSYAGGVEGVRADLETHGLAFASAYCSLSLVDPSLRERDLESMRRWSRQIASLGGEVAVVGPDEKTRDDFTTADYARIGQTLNDVGRVCAEAGVVPCFHPHTGTPVETMSEIVQVLDAIDPALVGFAPDTGQLAKGGNDPVEIVSTYRELIRHIHLKDYVGGVTKVAWSASADDRTGYLDYTPLGQGVVDIPAILTALGDDYSGWLMVELDSTPVVPRPPTEAARMSLEYLLSVLESRSSD